MKREFLMELKVAEQPLPKEIIDAIMAENGRDIQSSRQAAQEWQDKYTQAVQAHEKQLADLSFQTRLREAVTAMHGRNLKAITALLDVDALRQSEDDTALDTALAALKKDCGYLFEMPQTPPPYAGGTGVRSDALFEQPATLAGALREKFERK